MNINFKFCYVLMFCVTLLMSCKKDGSPINKSDDKNVDAKIDSILSLLTLDEKVAMCHAQSNV